MAVGKSVESISPFTVYKRVIIGAVLAGIGLFLPVHDSNDQTLKWGLIFVGVFLFVWGMNSVRNPRLALKYANSPLATVADLISEWKPTLARLESEYERSLHQFLKTKLTFVKVTRQYSSARVKCDIAVGTDVMIEMKAGFKSTQKLQRLLGQIDLFHREWQGKPLIVLLLGESEDDLLHDLNRSLHNYPSVKVIVKETGKAIESNEEKAKAHSA